MSLHDVMYISTKKEESCSLRIDGGHLGCCVSRLARSFADVAILVHQLRGPVDKKKRRKKRYIVITDYHRHISKPQTLCTSNNLLERKTGCLGSWRAEQQLCRSPVCDETNQRGLVQIITLAAVKQEPRGYQHGHQ